jgi:hypothetical protein
MHKLIGPLITAVPTDVTVLFDIKTAHATTACRITHSPCVSTQDAASLCGGASALFTYKHKRREMVYLSLSLCGWLDNSRRLRRYCHTACVFSFLATCTRCRGRVIKSILIDSTGRCNNKARRSRKGGLGFSEAANRDDRAKPNKHHQREHCKVNTRLPPLYFLLTAAQTTARLCLGCPATFSLSLFFKRAFPHCTMSAHAPWLLTYFGWCCVRGGTLMEWSKHVDAIKQRKSD